MSEDQLAIPAAEGAEAVPWLTRGVRGIGAASLLSDAGHEISTALLPSLLTSTLGAPAAALGLIEGVSDGLSGVAKLAGGAPADDPRLRRRIAVGGYAVTAVLSGLIGVAQTAWHVGALRAGAWASRGFRGPSRHALLAEVVDRRVYGRAYGFERMMDNLGAIAGPLLALALVSAVGIRWAIGLSVIPGLLAALAILYAIRHAPRPTRQARVGLVPRIRPVLRGDLGRLFVAVSAFEVGNVAATLLILRATEVLTPGRGVEAAAALALVLYALYNLAAAVSSLPAGRLADRWGPRGPIRVFVLGVLVFAVAYAGFAVAPAAAVVLAVPFVAAGVAIGCVETAENAAVAGLAPDGLRGSAFGLLAAVQAAGNLAASAGAGLIWTMVSPGAAFGYLVAWMLAAAVAALTFGRSSRPARTGPA